MRSHRPAAIASASASLSVGVFVEIGARVAEARLLQVHEALDVPAAHRLLVGVDIDGEIEEVGDEGDRLAVLRQVARLQHVQPFQDQDVGPVDDDRLARHDVVGEVRIDRRA